MLLKSSENQLYFTGAQLDANNPYVVKITATNAWNNLPVSQKLSIKQTIFRLWQESIGYTESKAVIEIINANGVSHQFSGGQ